MNTMADMIERIQQCALCEDAVATLGYETQHFNYGPGADGIVVEAIVPVWTCAGCGEQYLDDEAEDIKHDAVCAHLGRLAPREVKAMRVTFGMLQEEFAAFSGYGSASIKRWESGSQIQSDSVDKHLRLLRSLGVAEAVKRTSRPAVPEFRTPISASTRALAQRFKLRTPAYELEAMAA